MARQEAVIDELDLAILALLPDEGSKLGKYLPDARPSKRIKKELDDPLLSSMMVGRRMAELHKFGLVVLLRNDSKIGWQRTAEGKKILDRVPSEK